MKTQTINIENNKLIAFFMEYEHNPNDYGEGGEETWEVGIDNYKTLEELEFHSSWDWLMPVVEKFICLNLEGKEWDFHYEKIHDALWAFNLEELHMSLSNAIKWYNEQEEIQAQYDDRREYD